jgi:membrane protease YdiL (CAAX protease family)
LTPILGIAGTVLLTSTTFAVFHLNSVAFLPALAVPVFVANTFTLGLACGILMLKTDSIWGAYLIHMAADVFLFIATLATNRRRGSDEYTRQIWLWFRRLLMVMGAILW